MQEGDEKRRFTARDARYVGLIATLMGVLVGIGATRQHAQEQSNAMLLLAATFAGILTFAMLHGIRCRIIFAAATGVYATVIAGTILAFL
jgi:hypothetical protein